MSAVSGHTPSSHPAGPWQQPGAPVSPPSIRSVGLDRHLRDHLEVLQAFIAQGPAREVEPQVRRALGVVEGLRVGRVIGYAEADTLVRIFCALRPPLPVLIGPALVQRDADGWWQHPELPACAEDPEAFHAWLAAQGLELAHWSMERDGLDDHPYWDAQSPRHDCRGWAPQSPGPEWFLLSLFDSEEGPYVNWVRRVAAGEGAA